MLSIRKSLPVYKNVKNNENEKKSPPTSQPLSKQNHDKDKLDHNKNASESTNSTEPGAVAVEERYAWKVKQKTEVQVKYNASFDHAVALPGHYPINEEPKCNFFNGGCIFGKG